MSRYVSNLLVAAAAVTMLSTAACSAGEDEGRSAQQQQQTLKKKDGKPSGDGNTCSWIDVPVLGPVVAVTPGAPVAKVGSETRPGDPAVAPAPAPLPGPYAVGDTFASLDGCNECTCTASGIMCTMRECGGGGAVPPGGGGDVMPPTHCSEEAMICPDGSTVTRTGPRCEFAECPTRVSVCTADVKECPDGSYVARTGPNCEFAPCTNCESSPCMK